MRLSFLLPSNFGLIAIQLFCLVATLRQSSEALFSPDFGQWLTEHFGHDVRVHLERSFISFLHNLLTRYCLRPDLGAAGSFGGRTYQGEALKNQPVVFVHGVSNRAGDLMKQAVGYMLKSRRHYKHRDFRPITSACMGIHLRSFM